MTGNGVASPVLSMDPSRLLASLMKAAEARAGAVDPAAEERTDEPGVPEPEEEDVYADVEEKTILDEIQKLEEEGGKIRMDEERDWQVAWRFYNGKHWGEWNQDGQLVDLDDEDIPHLVLNYILHLVQTRLAHLTKNRPVLQGLPGRPDEKARNATRLAVRVIEAYWRKLRMPKKLAEALLWMLVCGKSFWKVYWDPTAGRTVRRNGAPRPMMNAAGEPLVSSETGEPGLEPNPLPAVKEGDLGLAVVFPHEILVNAGAMDLDPTNPRGAQKLLHTTYKPLAEVKARWKFTEEELLALQNAADSNAGPRSGDQARRELEGLSNAAGTSLAGLIPVKELWARAGAVEGCDRGLRAVVINGKVAIRTSDGQRELTPTPRGYGEIPFVEFDEIKTNSFWSTSTARQLIDINQCINVEISQQEHRRKVLRYKTLIPEQAQIDKDAFDRTDTEVITYWAPFAPTHLAPPEVRQNEIEIRNSLIRIIKEIGGNFDVLGGKTSGEVRSGRQTAYLQEYAGVLLALVAQLVEWSLTVFGNMALKLLQSRVTEQRFEAFVGRDRRVQVVSFLGTDLDGCGEIIVQPMSSLLMSRTERMDRIEKWMTEKWLSPDIGLRLLDLGDFDTEIYSEEEQDRQNADEMCFRLQGAPAQFDATVIEQATSLATTEGNIMSERYILRVLKIEAFPFDNHPIHQQQIDRNLRKTAEYREWPPAKRALTDALWEWHELFKKGGPIETSIQQEAIPSGRYVVPGVPPPVEAGAEPQTHATSGLPLTPPPGAPGAPVPGQPQPESGAERAEGAPSVPAPPGPGPGPGSLPPR